MKIFLRDARQPEVSLFSLLICLDATKFVLLAVFTLIETICSNICSKSRLKIAKSQLPVYVRRSKTLLFKPPNSFSIYSETLTMYQTLPCYETCSRLDTKKIRLKEIGTLSALRNALQNTLSPFPQCATATLRRWRNHCEHPFAFSSSMCVHITPTSKRTMKSLPLVSQETSRTLRSNDATTMRTRVHSPH